jgi:uncharacterized membrane protein YdjX (TVP38/TMEM64 family)
VRRLLRPLLLIAVALAAPIVPFLFLGDELNARVNAWLDPRLPPSTVAALVAGVLATDVLLPVPSSAVSTYGGAQLGIIGGTVASWLGMTAGAVGGFALARWFGTPLARRLARQDDLQRLSDLIERFGPATLAITRAAPVLAEASVLLMGMTRLPWRRFLPPVLLSNLGIAAVYSAFGRLASHYNSLPVALVASIALPVAAVTIVRLILHRPQNEPPA